MGYKTGEIAEEFHHIPIPVRERKDHIRTIQKAYSTINAIIDTIHILERDGILRQDNIPIFELAERVKLITPVALIMDEHGGGHRLPFLCRNYKSHRAKSDGQGQWQHPISIAKHHGAKIHFFRVPTPPCRAPLPKEGELGATAIVVDYCMQLLATAQTIAYSLLPIA